MTQKKPSPDQQATKKEENPAKAEDQQTSENGKKDGAEKDKMPKEHCGRKGPEPTRYGDWEVDGKCVDF